MRTLIAFLFAAAVYGQELPDNIYGTWVSFEQNDQLNIYHSENKTFFIRENDGSILAEGRITVDGNYFVITRSDVNENYSLASYVGNETMIIIRPNENKAWLWVKTSNY